MLSSLHSLKVYHKSEIKSQLRFFNENILWGNSLQTKEKSWILAHFKTIQEFPEWY